MSVKANGQLANRPNQRYQPLVVMFVALAAGVFADHALQLGLAVWQSLAIAAWLAWFGLWLRRWERASAVALLVSASAVAGGWSHCRWNLYDADDISLYANEHSHPVALEGQIAVGPRFMPAPPRDPLRTMPLTDRTRLAVNVSAIRAGRDWRAASGAVMLIVNGPALNARAGDRVRVFGQISETEPPDNPGVRDYAFDARADRCQSFVFLDAPACVTRRESAGGGLCSSSRLQGVIDSLRAVGREQLIDYLSPRYAGLATAMFLGVREDLQPEDSQAFFETGTVHLLVVSGLNVGILATALLALLRLGLRPRGAALAAVVALVALYALVTDSQPPVVRAAAMVVVACGAQFAGRRPLSFNSLALAAIVVLAINPADLFRVGPQLSFLCVAVLAWWTDMRSRRPPLDPLDRLIAQTRPWPERLARRAGQATGLSLAQSGLVFLVVSPLLLSKFHLLSLSAVALGPLLAAPVAIGMASGFLVIVFGAWLPLIASLSGAVCDACLRLVDAAVRWGQTVPAGHFWLPGPSEWWLGGFYLALALWAAAPRQWRPPTRWLATAGCFWLSVGMIAGWVERSRDRALVCTVISVGHGSAVVLELPDGRALLYDAGRLGPPLPASRAIAGYLWSRGRTHLDAVVLSHADADHYNALPSLARQFSIGVVYVSPMMFEKPTAGLDALQGALAAAHTRVEEIWAPDRLKVGSDCTIEVLHPTRRGVLGSDNANSIVLAIEYAGRRLLLTGDLESPGLDAVLAEEPYDVDVLLAPHHGSQYSAAPRVAAWCNPEWTIISGADRDGPPAVVAAFQAHGAVLHTAHDGAVQTRFLAMSEATDGQAVRGGIETRTWRDGAWRAFAAR
jgi:competence protein ComEC